MFDAIAKSDLFGCRCHDLELLKLVDADQLKMLVHEEASEQHESQRQPMRSDDPQSHHDAPAPF
jgi:hypothetical protein